MTNTNQIQLSEQEISNTLASELQKNYLYVSIIGVTIQYLWTFSDLVIAPERWFEFFTARTIAFFVPVIVCLFYKKLGLRPVFCMFTAAVAIGCVSMFATFSMSVDPFRSYVLGDIAYFVGVGMLATWELRYTIATIAITVSFALVTYALRSPLDINTMLTNGGFTILTVAALSIVMTHSRYKSRLFQTKTRLELERSLQTIQEQSSENNNLQLQLHLNEKASLIGEITSAISHELNTPLSVVAVGAKAINETLVDTVKLMSSVEKEQWPLIFQIVKGLEDRKPSLSTLSQLKEAGSLEKAFYDINGKALDQMLARKLVATGLSGNDKEWLSKIGQNENHEILLNVIKKMKDLHEFTGSIEQAVSKSSTVIQELKLLVQAPKIDSVGYISVRTSLEKALLLIEQTHPGKLVCRLDQTLNVQWKVDEIGLIQLWFKALEFICLELNSDQATEISLSIFEKSDDYHLSLNVNSPVTNTLRKIQTSSYLSILQQKDSINSEFQMSIVQSLLANFNAEISISEWQDSFELFIRVPKSVVS